jgi:hypothetical protein
MPKISSLKRYGGTAFKDMWGLPNVQTKHTHRSSPSRRDLVCSSVLKVLIYAPAGSIVLLICLHILAAISINIRRPSSAVRNREKPSAADRHGRLLLPSKDVSTFTQFAGTIPCFMLSFARRAACVALTDDVAGMGRLGGGGVGRSLTLNERGVARDNDHNLR